MLLYCLRKKRNIKNLPRAFKEEQQLGYYDAAMGWAWLMVHERTESDAWRFDEESRDKGGDWVPALTAVWDAAQALLMEDDLDSEADYRSSMEWLSEVSGSGSLP